MPLMCGMCISCLSFYYMKSNGKFYNLKPTTRHFILTFLVTVPGISSGSKA